MISMVLALALAASPKTVVLDLKTAGGVDPDFAKTAALLLPTEVRRYAEGAVISGEDIRSLLGLERQKQLLGCTESSCLAEVAGALGADELIDGTLGKLGDSLVIELHRVDVRKASTKNSVARTIKDDPDAFPDALRGAVAELYGREAPEPEVMARAPAGGPAWPAVIGGGGLIVAGAIGGIWALSVHGQVADQQDPSVTPTVSSSTARAASVVFPISIAAVVAGAGLVTYGLLRRPPEAEQTEESETTFSVAPSRGGAMVAVQGRF